MAQNIPGVDAAVVAAPASIVLYDPPPEGVDPITRAMEIEVLSGDLEVKLPGYDAWSRYGVGLHQIVLQRGGLVGPVLARTPSGGTAADIRWRPFA